MIALDTQVVSIESLTPFVQKVMLDAQQPLSFKAGQYIQVIMGENDKRPFSIANMPSEDGLLELHIGATPDNAYAYEVIQQAKNEGTLRVEVAHGDAYLRESDRPLVIIAGGTGYSYAKSIILESLARQTLRTVHLFWGVRQFEDLYEYEHLSELAQFNSNFSFTPVIEEAEQTWQGKSGLVHKAALREYRDMSGLQVYVAGRFEMAKIIRSEFPAQGLPQEQLFGDAFAFI